MVGFPSIRKFSTFGGSETEKWTAQKPGWLKIKRSEGQTAGFGPCFHLPGQAILEFSGFLNSPRPYVQNLQASKFQLLRPWAPKRHARRLGPVDLRSASRQVFLPGQNLVEKGYDAGFCFLIQQGSWRGAWRQLRTQGENLGDKTCIFLSPQNQLAGPWDLGHQCSCGFWMALDFRSL